MFFEYRCLGCGTCARVCPIGAIAFPSPSRPRLDREKCTGCGECAKACPSGAWRLVGQTIGVEELLGILERDRLLYERSGGGVTFSGGEPLFQPEFLSAALRECKKLGIHTAVDTSGFAPTSVLTELAPLTDLFLYDLKPMDEEEHRRYTGVPNKLIHENLRALVELGRPVIVRLPLVPGITDTERNIALLRAFLRELRGGIQKVELLPYHDVAEKYQRLGKNYGMPELPRPPEERLLAVRTRIAEILPCP